MFGLSTQSEVPFSTSPARTIYYPTLGQDISSTEVSLDDLEISRASNGLLISRSYYSAASKEFSLVQVIDTLKKDALVSFYNDNRNNSFVLFWVADNTIHNCMFMSPPKFTMLGSSNFWNLTYSLIKV